MTVDDSQEQVREVGAKVEFQETVVAQTHHINCDYSCLCSLIHSQCVAGWSESFEGDSL